MHSEFYTASFYEKLRTGSAKSAEAIVPLVLGLLPVSSVVDVGCGDGSWLSVFRKVGVEDVLGLDGEYVDRNVLQIPHDRFQAADLAKPFGLKRVFDLAISLEVAEHLPAESASGFVASLCGLAPAVLFSAAIPFQGGNHHINEQWPDKWAELFKEHNYVPVDFLRKRVWQNETVEWWYAQNTLLFVRPSLLESNPQLKAEFERTTPDQLRLVHPRQYLYLQSLYREAAVRAENPPPPSGLKKASRIFLVCLKNAIRWRLDRIAKKQIFAWLGNLYWSLRPGSRPLVFDVGANVGAKTEQYLRNGAKVVCFEPQSACVDALRERFRGNRGVVVVPAALGNHIGEAKMSVCTQESAISTFVEAWKTGRFKDKIWDRAEVVPVTTLDAAIDRHGMPFYCKIDVEGFEPCVLSGLTRQIPVLSFEFCAEGLDQTQECLDLLSRLGYGAFNACLGETGVYILRAAVSAAELMNYLRSISDPLAWGDVYAAVGLRMPTSKLLPSCDGDG